MQRDNNMVVVAQLAERQDVNLEVAGSSPAGHPTGGAPAAAFGDRLMAGRKVLALEVGVRLFLPELHAERDCPDCRAGFSAVRGFFSTCANMVSGSLRLYPEGQQGRRRCHRRGGGGCTC